MKTSKTIDFSQNCDQHYKIYTFQPIESSDVLGTTFWQRSTSKTQHFWTPKGGSTQLYG